MAPGDEHRRDLHAQPRGRFGPGESLDRRQAVGLPGMRGDASSHAPLGLLEQFQVELRLESTGQVFTCLNGLDQIGLVGLAPGDRADDAPTVGHVIPAGILHQGPQPAAELLRRVVSKSAHPDGELGQDRLGHILGVRILEPPGAAPG